MRGSEGTSEEVDRPMTRLIDHVQERMRQVQGL